MIELIEHDACCKSLKTKSLFIFQSLKVLDKKPCLLFSNMSSEYHFGLRLIRYKLTLETNEKMISPRINLMFLHYSLFV